MKENKNTQEQLAEFCRTGRNEPITSIQENTKHYRRLVKSTVHETIKRAFPIFLDLIGDEKMGFAIENFFIYHKASSAQVWHLPYEFYLYYKENDLPFEHNILFVEELLLFEWLEIELFMMEDLEIPSFEPLENYQLDTYVFNPERTAIPLTYPIHKKKTKKITETDKGHYFISVHRDIQTKQVKFNEISIPLVLFLESSQEEDNNFKRLLEICLRYTKDREKAKSYALNLVQFSYNEGIILGAKPKIKS